jgi:hypothetical protein
MKETLRRQNSRLYLAKFLPASLVDVSAGYCQRALLDESLFIRSQLGDTQ